jgi:hypothetical protein
MHNKYTTNASLPGYEVDTQARGMLQAGKVLKSLCLIACSFLFHCGSQGENK